jgi:hypothetical protein
MWLPALAAASIIKVIMAGQRMRQPARGRNGSYTALLAAWCRHSPRRAVMHNIQAGWLHVEPTAGPLGLRHRESPLITARRPAVMDGPPRLDYAASTSAYQTFGAAGRLVVDRD